MKNVLVSYICLMKFIVTLFTGTWPLNNFLHSVIIAEVVKHVLEHFLSLLHYFFVFQSVVLGVERPMGKCPELFVHNETSVGKLAAVDNGV